MRLNLLFTKCLIVTYVFSLVCFLKQQNNFLKCWIPDRRIIWIFRYLPNSIFYFCQPVPLLPSTISAAGYRPSHLCGFRCAPYKVSGIHVSDSSAIAWFLFFYFWPVMRMRRSLFPLWFFVGTLLQHIQSLVFLLCPLAYLYKTNVIGLRYSI